MKIREISGKNTLARLFVFAIWAVFTLGSVQAQTQGKVGLGIQIGQPSGVSLLVPASKFDTDILVAWDLGDFFYANVHGLLSKPLSGSDLSFFYGPGAYIGVRDRGNSFEDDITVGISGTIGLRIFIERFEIYARVTPRLQIIDSTEGDIGGGVGFRFYL